MQIYTGDYYGRAVLLVKTTIYDKDVFDDLTSCCLILERLEFKQLRYGNIRIEKRNTLQMPGGMGSSKWY